MDILSQMKTAKMGEFTLNIKGMQEQINICVNLGKLWIHISRLRVIQTKIPSTYTNAEFIESTQEHPIYGDFSVTLKLDFTKQTLEVEALDLVFSLTWMLQARGMT